MPRMITAQQAHAINGILASPQSRARGYSRVSNRCYDAAPITKARFNRASDLVPKPMRAEDVQGVLKSTGFMPISETKFVRRGT